MSKNSKTTAERFRSTVYYDTLLDSTLLDTTSGIPFDILKWWSFGFENYKNKKYEDAIEYFWLVFIHYKGTLGRIAIGYMAHSYYELNEIDSVLIASYRGLAEFEDQELCHTFAGLVQDSLGYKNCAISHYEFLTELNQDNKENLSILARLYYETNNFKCIEVQQKVVDLDPSDMSAQETLDFYIQYFAMNCPCSLPDSSIFEQTIFPSSSVDEPPERITLVEACYPSHLRENNIEVEGTVLVNIVIDTLGNVAFASIQESIPELDSTALCAALKYTFRPAVQDSKKVNAEMVIGIEFSLVTGISYKEIIPAKFELYPAYPNPFNPSTTLSFHLDKAEHVNIKIFNIRGQFIEEIIDEYRNPGINEIIWDATGFPSGLYLIQVSTAELSLIKKAILLK